MEMLAEPKMFLFLFAGWLGQKYECIVNEFQNIKDMLHIDGKVVEHVSITA